MSNYYTSTWPGSPFVHRPVVVRKDERAVRRLVGTQLTVGDVDGDTHADIVVSNKKGAFVFLNEL